MVHWRTGRFESEDVFEAYSSIAGEALQFYDADIWKTYAARVGKENFRGVWNGETFAGGLAFYRMGQWFGGKCLSTAGVSGVAIEPASRGSGACKKLLTDLIQELFDEGIPFASLYASTQQLYRSVGFEQAGYRFLYSMPMSCLRELNRKQRLPVQRLMDPPLSVLNQVMEFRSRRNNGNLQRTAGLWARVTAPIGITTSSYVIGSDDAPEGFCVLHHGHRSAGFPQPLTASDWVANSPAALDRLIGLVLDHRSMCDCFRWAGGPQDPLLMAGTEQDIEVTSQLRWHSRIVCVKKTFELRGYPRSFSGAIDFEISDPLIEANRGKWRLTIDGGVPSMVAGGEGLVRIDVSQLVPLFTSLLSCSQLIQFGWATCDDPQMVHAADTAFAGPAPWTSEMY